MNSLILIQQQTTQQRRAYAIQVFSKFANMLRAIVSSKRERSPIAESSVDAGVLEPTRGDFQNATHIIAELISTLNRLNAENNSGLDTIFDRIFEAHGFLLDEIERGELSPENPELSIKAGASSEVESSLTGPGSGSAKGDPEKGLLGTDEFDETPQPQQPTRIPSKDSTEETKEEITADPLATVPIDPLLSPMPLPDASNKKTKEAPKSPTQNVLAPPAPSAPAPNSNVSGVSPPTSAPSPATPASGVARGQAQNVVAPVQLGSDLAGGQGQNNAVSAPFGLPKSTTVLVVLLSTEVLIFIVLTVVKLID